MGRTPHKSIFAALLTILLLICISAHAQDANRMGETSAKLMELQKKLEAYSSNVECQRKITLEMNAISQQYQSLAKSGGQTQPQ